MKYPLTRFAIPGEPIDFTAYYQEYYGVNVNTLSSDTQEILALAKEFGASQAIMMFLQKLQRSQVEPTATES